MEAASEALEPWRRGNMGRFLVWEDLTVVLPNLRISTAKKLLSGLSGYAQPGRLVAIMGPSGSGKSTLLDSLAGRLSANVAMTGNVIYNGKRRGSNCRDARDQSYITQEDVFLGTLTVRETMTFSAHLKLPAKMTKAEIDEVVDETITNMGLQECADNKIGNWHSRGISSGEKKRLSIGLEILTAPNLLFLDEPTSSLDSASAFYVIKALKNIAADGRIVVCSIHQPSSDLFNEFDDLVLLSGGKAVYFGETCMAVRFFADAGVPCPTRKSPADHFLQCISSDFDALKAPLIQSQRTCGTPNFPRKPKTAEIIDMLLQKYGCSEYSMEARTRILAIKLIDKTLDESNNGGNPSWWKQLCTLTHRSFLNMSRDLGYYWVRIIFYLFVSASLGTLFNNPGRTYVAVVARGELDVFIYSYMLFLSITGLPSYIEETKVSDREVLNGHYKETIFVLSNLLSSLPFLVMISLSTGTILHFMVNFRPEFSCLAFFCTNYVCCIAAVESLTMITASLVPNLLMGIGAGTGTIGIMMMASSISRRPPDLPKFFWYYPMSYISFASWGLQGHFKNDLIGLDFESWLPRDQKMKGEVVMDKMFGVELNHSKGWDLAAVMLLVISYRVLFTVVLKYKERVSSSLSHKLYTKVMFG